MFRKATAFVAAVLAMGAVVAPAHADNDVKAELASMKAEIAQLRAETGKTYVEGRRADEVKSMIAGVLEDSESRNALADGSSTAGYDGGFFLASADGNFLMEISVYFRFRWYGNFRDFDNTSVGGTDEIEFTSGFELTGVEFGFEGHAFDPDILYSLVFSFDNDGDVTIDTAAIGYSGTFEGFEVWAGNGIDVSTSVEQYTSSKKQSAVERSYVSRNVTIAGGSAVGIYAGYSHDFFTIEASLTNSGNAQWDTGGGAFGAATSNGGYNLSTRVNVKLLGEWDQYDDLVSWGGEDVLLVLGGGFAVQYGANSNGAFVGTGAGTHDGYIDIAWDVDLRFEWNGLSIWIAGSGVHFDLDEGGANIADSVYGLVGGISYNILDTVEIFARGEGVFIPDSADAGNFNGGDGLGIVTVGASWFIYKHSLKLTADLGFVIGTVNGDDAGAGILATPTGTTDETPLQVVVRLQVLMYF